MNDAIFARLYPAMDKALPAYGFNQTPDAWIATKGKSPCCGSNAATHLHVYKDTPFGIKCHRCDGFTPLSKIAGGLPRLMENAGIPMDPALNGLDQYGLLVKAFKEHLAGDAALAYLKSRGLTDEVIEKEGYGLHPGSERMNQRGLLQPLIDAKLDSTDWCARIIVPYRDSRGRIIGFWGRHPHDQGERKYLFTQGIDKSSPYGLYAVDSSKPVLAVEGLMSRDILLAQGIPNVIAVGGSKVTKEQAKCLRGHQAASVLISFDYDPVSKAGEKGTVDSIPLIKDGMRCYVLPTDWLSDDPAVKEDPDSYVLKRGADAYRALMDKAIDGRLYLVKRVLQDLKPDNHEHVDRAIDAAARIIGQDATTITRIVDELSVWAGIDPGTVMNQLEIARLRVLEIERINKAKKSLSAAINLVSDGNFNDARRLLDRAIPEGESRGAPPSFFDDQAFIAEVSLEQYEQRATGLDSLDQMASILPGELVIICARPRHGKSSLAYNWFLHWVETYSDTSIFFTHELPLAHMMARLATIWVHKNRHSRLNYKEEILKNYQRKQSDGSPAMPKDALDALRRFGEYGRQHRMIPAWQPGWNARQIASYTEKIHEEHPVGGVIIDYVEMIPPLDNTVIREQQLSQTVHELRLMANRLNIPVVLLSQISRECKRPTLEGLRYSGALEQEASTVIGLFNESQESNGITEDGSVHTDGQAQAPIEVIVLKNRGGMQGTKKVVFDMQSGLIADDINPFQKPIK